jgi:hypothetical protein
MLFLTVLEQRIIIVSIAQSWPIFYSILFSYKILKRSRNPSTISLSSFFLMSCVALSLLIISILTVNTSISYFFYIVGYYFFFSANSFLIIFSWLVLNVDKKFSRRLYSALILIFFLTSTFVFWIGILFNGIQYSASTGWIPVFSLPFTIISWAYIGIFFILPEIIIGCKLGKTYQSSQIKMRIYLLVISILMQLFVLFFTVLYNFWIDNGIYRGIHVFINLPLETIAAYLIYKSLGKELA